MLATRVADVAIPDRGGAASHAPDVEVAGPAQGPHRRFDDPKEHALLVLGGSHPRCFDVGVGGGRSLGLECCRYFRRNSGKSICCIYRYITAFV